MEIIVYVLMLFVALNCVFKLSMWRWWQRAVYGVVLGGFTFWSQRYAILQSKTQLADYLQDTNALQTMAILATIETVFCFGYIYCYLEFWGGERRGRRKERILSGLQGKKRQSKSLLPPSSPLSSKILKYYPSLLMFPMMFYVLTQTIFVAVGVSFSVTAAALAVAVAVGLPLLAGGARWLLPDDDGRVEVQVLLSAFVCILGLISTETGKMVYKAQENPVDWRMASFALAVFAVLFLVGFAWSRWKWKILKK